MKGVLLDKLSLDNSDIDFSLLKSTVTELKIYDTTGNTEVMERIRDADIIISNKVRIERPHIAALNRARLICIAATGVNNVDIDAASERGISVSNVTGYATPSVVQHVFCLMLTLMTRLNEYQHLVRSGQWQRSQTFCLLDYTVYELSGKTLGIIGYGELGKAVAQVAKSFGMQILIAAHKDATPGAGRVSLQQTLSESDVLTLHCPLTPETSNLISETELRLMKPTALLINTARGGIVNEQALLNAIQNGVIAGAGIDVLSEEPPVHGNPLLSVNLPNLIITPHIAWASREARQRVINEVASNIAAFARGEKRNRVN